MMLSSDSLETGTGGSNSLPSATQSALGVSRIALQKKLKGYQLRKLLFAPSEQTAK
jgi:hypothetical protein